MNIEAECAEVLAGYVGLFQHLWPRLPGPLR